MWLLGSRSPGLPIIVGAEAPEKLADVPLGSRKPGLPVLLGLQVAVRGFIVDLRRDRRESA